MTAGSLFSGAGVCDLGLHWAGFEHQWFCEIDPFCRSILARHWPDVPIFNDVGALKGVDLPPVDVLVGGFPCQDVSSAGVRAGIKPGTRSGLWYEYARLIREIRPRYAIIENVRGLLSCGIEIVLQDLAAARQWIPRLKALGNAITPQQAYAIAACILEAEGMPVPPMPLSPHEGRAPRTRAARRP